MTVYVCISLSVLYCALKTQREMRPKKTLPSISLNISLKSIFCSI